MTSNPTATRTAANRNLKLTVACLAGAFLAGVVSAGQSRINGSFGVALGNSFLAGLIGFVIALAGLAVIGIASPKLRVGLIRVYQSVKAGESRNRNRFNPVSHPGVKTIGHLRWYQLMGGAVGGLFVASQGLSVPVIGVALFVVAASAGQSISSLLVDWLGFAPGGKRKITFTRVLGPALTVVAVFISGWPSISGRFAGGEGFPLWSLLVPFLAGMAGSFQLAANSRVEVTAAQTSYAASNDDDEWLTGVYSATFFNFLVGTAMLLLVLAISVATHGYPTGDGRLYWWMFLGGLLGTIFIAVTAAVIRRIGTLLAVLALVAGQTLGGLLLDLSAWGGSVSPPINTYLGVVLMLIAAAIPAVHSRLSE